MKIFKILFPKHYKELQISRDILKNKDSYIKELETQLSLKHNYLFEFDFSQVDDYAKPPHYLKGLSESGRKNYVGDLVSIYNNDKFHEVIKYCINLYGNKGMQSWAEDDIYKARYAILGIKTVMQEFENAYSEHERTKSGEEKFDPLELLPEN